jgi:DNA-binding transcriptional regulator YiaG
MTGQEIRDIRKRLGLSLSELAKALGLHGKCAERTIRRWQKRGNAPDDVEEKLRNLILHKGV